MKSFHLNRVTGWNNVLVNTKKNETELKMNLRNFPSII